MYFLLLLNAEKRLYFSVCVLPWDIGNKLEPNGTSAFPDTVTDLHCFDENIHDLDYYRPCEKKVREIEVSIFQNPLYEIK